MAFVDVAIAVGTAVGVEGISAGSAALLGGGILGAGAGALYNGLTGRDILTGALYGGALGAAGAGIGNALMADTAAQTAAATAPSATAVQTPIAASSPIVPAQVIAENQALMQLPGAINPATGLPFAETSLAGSSPISQAVADAATKTVTDTAGSGLGMKALGYGLAGTAALSLLGGMRPTGVNVPSSVYNKGQIRPFEYSSTPTPATGEYPSPYATTKYNAAGLPVLDTRERSYFDQKFTELPPYQAAKGGLMMADGGPVERMSAMDQGRGMYPQGMIDKTYYATPTQRPASMEVVRSDYDTPVNPITGVGLQFAEGGYTGYQGYGDRQDGLAQRPYNPFGEALVGSLMPKEQTTSIGVIGSAPSGGESQSASVDEPHPVLKAMYNKLSGQPDYQFTKPELVSGWQALNPNTFAYDPTKQAYSAATPDEKQLEVFKQQIANYMEEDRAKKAKEEQERQQGLSAAGGGLMAMGGRAGGEYNLGSYSDGGRLLKGPGDGMSDNIPAMIGKKQPARLADGEFVVPADVVSHLGNGSTDAGAKRLYAMMDKVRKARTGNKKQGKEIKAEKFLPA